MVDAQRVHVLHAVALLHHAGAAHRAAAEVMVATKVVVTDVETDVEMAAVNSVAMATTALMHRVLKVAATTVRVQKAALTTARFVKLHLAVTAAHVAIAMNCHVTSPP